MYSNHNTLKYPLYIFAIACIVALLHSCASISTPTGGARDEDPPRILRTSPANGSVGFDGRRLYIEFDELVNVKDAFTNVVVSPPQARVPKVSASGRRVIVEWDEDLLPDTTYTIDFGEAIQDVNEGNLLGAYSFSFSTGSAIDSLRISGMVLQASNLEPCQGVLVGVHSAEAPDSALRTLRFERITKTDERGRFTLRGLKAHPYRLFALADLNNDYRWDNPAELMAFYPTTITPYTIIDTATDTIYNTLTGKPDSTMSRTRTRYMPDNILLSMFDPGYKSQYLVKYERPDSARISLIFNTSSPTLPQISLLSGTSDASWALTEHSAHNDTITYWLTDPALQSTDTLRLAIGYQRTDHLKQLVDGTDTLSFIKPKVKAPVKKKMSKAQMIADSIAAVKASQLTISVLPSGSLDVYTPLIIESAEPLSDLSTDMIHLQQKQDTTYTTLQGLTIAADTLGNIRRYTLHYPWEYGASYRLVTDSAAMTGITGRVNAALSREFSIKKREDYASLTLRLLPDTISGYVEVLNTSDTPVAWAWVEHGIARFPYLSPADYYARFIHAPKTDTDFRPEYLTGDYDTSRQPADVYYYPKVLSLKRHDRSEQWDLNATAVDLQKPDAIKKNKPKTKSVSTRSKKNGDTQTTVSEEDDYFDVNQNPFDPKSQRRR